MLDAFLSVLMKQASDKKSEDALAEQMSKLPMKELQKIARVGIKTAFSDDGDSAKWLEKYEGTELYDQAIELEKGLLDIEAKRIQKRMDEHNRPEPEQEDLYTAEDMIRLKKRQLDLELSQLLNGVDEDEDEEEDEENEVAEAPLPAEEKKGPAEVKPEESAVPAEQVKSAEAVFDLAGRALAHAFYKRAGAEAPRRHPFEKRALFNDPAAGTFGQRVGDAAVGTVLGHGAVVDRQHTRLQNAMQAAGYTPPEVQGGPSGATKALHGVGGALTGAFNHGLFDASTGAVGGGAVGGHVGAAGGAITGALAGGITGGVSGWGKGQETAQKEHAMQQQSAAFQKHLAQQQKTSPQPQQVPAQPQPVQA